MIILNKKGDMRDIKNYRPTSPLSDMDKLSTQMLQTNKKKPNKQTKKDWERFLMKTKQEAGSEKGCSNC